MPSCATHLAGKPIKSVDMVSGDDETRRTSVSRYFPPSAAAFVAGSISSRVVCIEQPQRLVGQEAACGEET